MLTEERFGAILKIVEEEKSVTVQELKDRLGASESTIRRDLTELDRRGLLVKVHGGATAAGMDFTTKDVELTSRMEQNPQEKKEIGKYAATLVEKTDFIYLDAGSSVAKMAEYITETGAVFVTNGISHARILAGKGCTVYLLGGRFKGSTEALVGGDAARQIERYHFTKGFFGANGVDSKRGYTTPDPEEAAVKEAAMRQCARCYVLADSSKIGHAAPVQFAALSDAYLITSRLTDKELKKEKNIIEVRNDDIHSDI